MSLKLTISMLLVLPIIDGQKTIQYLDQFIVPYKNLKRVFQIDFEKSHNQNNVNQRETQDLIPLSMPFPCNTSNGRSSVRPSSVHELRPGDIDVIAAMGDSLTAGFGLTATNLFDVIVEERGKVFSIGGDQTWRQYMTLPNILKEFNPNIKGFSIGSSVSTDKNANLNVAEGGAISSDMPYMAKELIKRIKQSKEIDFKNDWKMVTLFIGSNNFCWDICYFKNPYNSLKVHKQYVTLALQLLRDNLPRTIVNLIPPPHMSKLVDLTVPPFCDFLHIAECPCFFGLPFQKQKNLLYDVMHRWIKIDLDFSGDPEFDRDDFAVVVQPFSLNYTFPTFENNVANLRYFSEDCFHFSQRMNARLANDLWNNIMEPIGLKALDGNNVLQKFHCPTNKHPYIFTKRNSFIKN